MASESSSVRGQLWPNERVVVELEGVVPGYTRWSGLGGIVGVVAALTVPRILNLGFWMGALSIIVVITGVFMLVYYFAGRRLAERSKPQTETPYILLVLTDRRVLIFDRGLGSDDLQLVEDVPVRDVSTIRYTKAGLLVPQQLRYTLGSNERRAFEFSRSQPVGEFVDRFQ